MPPHLRRRNQYSGDIVKAMAAGTNAVMIRLICRTDESPARSFSQRAANTSLPRHGITRAMMAGANRYGQEGNAPAKLFPKASKAA
jgi:hypothetical protein